MFAAITDANFGLNLDPSHLVWLMIDYERAVYDYADRIFHVHASRPGGAPRRPLPARVSAGIAGAAAPGLGEVNWSRFVAALYAVGYDHVISVEHERPALRGRPRARAARLPDRARHAEAVDRLTR